MVNIYFYFLLLSAIKCSQNFRFRNGRFFLTFWNDLVFILWTLIIKQDQVNQSMVPYHLYHHQRCQRSIWLLKLQTANRAELKPLFTQTEYHKVIQAVSIHSTNNHIPINLRGNWCFFLSLNTEFYCVFVCVCHIFNQISFTHSPKISI